MELLFVIFLFAFLSSRRSQSKSQGSQSEIYGGDANVEKPYDARKSAGGAAGNVVRNSAIGQARHSRAQSQSRTGSRGQTRTRRNENLQQRSKRGSSRNSMTTAFDELAAQLKEISQSVQGVGSPAQSDVERLRARESRRNDVAKTDVEKLAARQSQSETPDYGYDYLPEIRDPELAISTKSVFDSEDLEAELLEAEDFYSGSEIEDDSWMNLEDQGILMEVDHTLEAGDTVADSFQSDLRSRDRLVQGLIIGEILGKSKVRQ